LPPEDVLEEIDEATEETPEPTEAEAAAAAAEAAKAAIVDPAEFKRVQRELKAERTSRKESDATARYWAEKARSAPEKAQAAEKEDDLSDVDLVEQITTHGAKGLDTVLRRLGYAKTSEVRAEIGSTRAQITSEATLMAQYPELADDQSPLFHATASIYNSLKGDPEFKGAGSKLIAMAARTAKAELKLKGGDGRGNRRGAPVDELDPDDEAFEEDEETPEQARAARTARQAGDRGRRATGGAPTLSPGEKAMVAKFKAAGAEITEEGYLRRANRTNNSPRRAA
jgi:hypothetical protein